MSDNHCWYVFRRVACALIAFAIILHASATPASAAEEDYAAKPAANVIAADTLSIADAAASQDGAEPLSIANTAASQDGAAEPVFAPADMQAIPAASPVVERDAAITNPTQQQLYDEALQQLYEDDNEVYELILTLERKSETLSGSVIGLQQGFNYYLPMLELARIIKFPVEADLAGGRIQGSFLNPINTFSVNTQTSTYTVRGETFALPAGSFIVRDLGQGVGDIYFTPEILNKIWPLDLELFYSNLEIRINTPVKIPLEQERERKKQQDKLAAKEDGHPGGPQLENIPNGYKLLGLPTFEISNSFLWDGSEKALQDTLSVYGQNDLLGTSADYAVNVLYENGEPADITSARLRMTREDFGDGALPFGLKIAQIGDISARPASQIETLISGRGLYVSSSDRRSRKQNFDEITVEGTATPGWEAEVYSGPTLIDFGYVDETGLYRFENVPLTYGNNSIRVVLYGPQGQIEERIEDYSIKNNMLSPGETSFDAGIMDYREDLIPTNNTGSRRDEGIAQTVRVDRGLTHWLSGFATATSVPSFKGTNKYVTIGGNITAYKGIGQIEAYKQLNGGTALDTRYTTNFAGVNLNLHSAVFRDFESRENGFDGNAKKFEGEFRASKSFNIPFGLLGLDAKVEETRYVNKTERTRFGFQQSLSRERLQFNNIINTDLIDKKHEFTEGEFSLSTRLNDKWGLRSALEYNLFPERGLDTSRNTLNYYDGENFTAGLTVNQGIEDRNKTNLGLNLGYDFGTFLGSFETRWDKGEGVDFILNANTTLGPDIKDNHYIFATKYNGYQTALKLQVYEDKDLNDAFSEGDEPIKGVKVKINGQRNQQESDAEGYIDILSAGAPGLAEITIDKDSLPDPFLDFVRDGYKTVLRARTKPFIQIPMTYTGTIDGYVRFADNRPIPGVVVQLIGPHGQVLQEKSTVYDGFYVFEFVKPGTYTVRLDPSHTVFVPPQTVTVTSTNLLLYGVDLQVLEQAAEVSVAEEADGDVGRVAHTYHTPVTEGTKQPAPSTTGGGFQPAVRSVRIGEHPHKVRLVLDLSEPADYRISRNKDGTVIYVDLPNTTWDADRTWSADHDTLINNFTTMALPEGGTRLRLEAGQSVDVFYNALLAPDQGKGHRLCIDFMRVTNR